VPDFLFIALALVAVAVAVVWGVGRWHLRGADLSVFDRRTGERFSQGDAPGAEIQAVIASLGGIRDMLDGVPLRQYPTVLRKYLDEIFADRVLDVDITPVDCAGVPGEWVLAAKHNDGPVCVKSLAKQIGDRQRESAPMKNRTPLIDTLKLLGGKWTPHDLRRTGATMMGTLGVQSEVIERCLNHKEQNTLKRIYQRHDYRAEMRAAWLLLGDRLDLLKRSDADNVLTYQRAGVN